MSDLIGPHLSHLRAAGLSKATVNDREAVLRRLDAELPFGIDEASTEELQEWLGRDGWSTKTRETYWCHIVGFFRWALVAPRGLDWDPSEAMPRPKPRKRLPRPVTTDQLRHALDRLGHPWYLAVLLASAVGMRASEIANADREDFTEERVIIVGKGERSRSVPTDPRVWAEVRDRPGGRLITWNGEPVTGHWVSGTTSYQLKKIGMRGVTLHRFRHLFATILQREFRDLQLTADLLGHSSTETTVGYALLTDGTRRLGMQAVSAVLTSILGDHQPGSSRLVVVPGTPA